MKKIGLLPLVFLALFAGGVRAAGPYPASPGPAPTQFAASASGFGQALSTVNGTQGVPTLPDVVARFPAASSWSVSLRFNVSALPPAPFLSRNTGGAGTVTLGLSGSGIPRAVVYGAGGTGTTLQISTPSLADGQWHTELLVCEYTGAQYNYRLYLDGGAAGRSVAVLNGPAWDPGAGPAALQVAGSSGQPTQVDTALLDELQFVAAAVTTAATYTVNTAPAPNNTPSQVALYHFDGDLTDSNSTGLASASALTVTGPAFIQQGQTATYSVTPSASGAPASYAGTATLALTGFSGASSTATWTGDASTKTITVTPAASGSPSTTITGASLTATGGAGITAATVLPVTVYKVTVPPTAPTFTNASTTAFVGGLFARVYNARYSPILPRTLLGDGTSDDMAALQADANYVAAQGGGVLYLPIGVYNFPATATASFQWPSNVVLMGDGADTLLTYGVGTGGGGLFLLQNVNQAGLYNLSLLSSAGIVQVLPAAPYHTAASVTDTVGGVNANFFLKGVTWGLGGGDILRLNGIANLDVEDCVFDGRNQRLGFLLASRCPGLAFVRNTCSYHGGRPLFGLSTGARVDSNQFIMDGGPVPVYGNTPFESGGPDISFWKDSSYTNNLMAVNGVPDLAANTGEALLSQGDSGNGGNFYAAGTLTAMSADGRTLTDGAQNWPVVNNNSSIPQQNGWQNQDGPLVLCLLSGNAVRQWHYVAAHTATTVIVDAPFTVLPQPGDKYCITTWVEDNVRVDRNQFINNHLGPFFEQGAVNSSFTNNVVQDSGAGFALYAWEYPGTLPNLNRQMAWNNVITGNTISNPRGRNYARIQVVAVQGNLSTFGNLTGGNRVYGNTIVPIVPNAGTRGNQDPNRKDGVFEWTPEGSVSNSTAPLGDAPFPGLNNGLGAFNAAQAALVPGAGAPPPVQPGAYNLGDSSTTRAAAQAIIQANGYLVYKGRAYYAMADLPAEFN